MNATRLRALGARVMRPADDGRRAAELAVANIVDAREAWEVLATRDLIPARWIDDPTLFFRRAEDEVDAPSERHPPTVRDCVTLASDVPGVEQAMLLLREAWSRLEFVGASAPSRVFWSCSGRRGVWTDEGRRLSSPPIIKGLFTLTSHVRDRLRLPYPFGEEAERGPFHGAALGLFEASDVVGVDFEALSGAPMSGTEWMSDMDAQSLMEWYTLADASLIWSRAAREALSIPAADTPMFNPFAPLAERTIRDVGVLGHYGRAFADVPDPLSPLWQILDLGYLVDLFRPVQLDTLIAPAR